MPLVVPVIFWICCLMLTIIPLVMKPAESVLAFIVMVLSGSVYYLLFVKWNHKPRAYQQCMGEIEPLVKLYDI